MTRLAAGALAAALSACATAQIHLPPEQAASLERDLKGQERFLRVSMYATPFFGDATKKLLTAVPPEQVRLLDNPDGTPNVPGRVEATFAAGTPVRILRLELPSSLTMAERVLYTPRTLAWVYFDVAGTPKNAPPYVLVLRPGLKEKDELLAELSRFASTESPSKLLDGFSDVVREAVRSKSALLDMPADALEMAWGYPERRKLELDGDKRKETWTWPGEKRVAVLVDGRVTELK